MSRKMIKRRKFYGHQKADRLRWHRVVEDYYPDIADTEPVLELYG